MEPSRIDERTLEAQVAGAPEELKRLALKLRDLVLETVPGADEAIKFHTRSYFKPNHPYKSIGGNLCMIAVQEDHVKVGFIHGAALPDPKGLLRGKAKSARHVEIRPGGRWDRDALRALLLAAEAHTPVG